MGDGATHDITADANCALTITAPAAGSSSRYVFSGGHLSLILDTCQSGTCQNQTYTYDYQYLVSFIANPSNAGTVDPNSTSWYNATSSVALSATPRSGNALAYWTSSNTSISITSSSAMINGSGTIFANFASSSSPVTVVNSSAGAATGFSEQRKMFQSVGLYWLFYCDGSNISYVTSPDGAIWSHGTSLGVPCGATYQSGQHFSLWYSNNTNTVYYIRVLTTSTDKNFYYRYGHPDSNGSVSWSIPEKSSATTFGYVDVPYVSVDPASGNIWAVVSTYDGTNYHLEVHEHNATGWYRMDILNVGTGNSSAGNVLFANSGIDLIYGSTSGKIFVSTSSNGGLNWTNAVGTSANNYAFSDSEVVVVGNTIYVATTNRTSQASDSVFFLSYKYGNMTWSQATLIGLGRGATLSTDGSTYLVLAYHINNTPVGYIVSTNLGSTWSNPTLFNSTETSIRDNIIAAYSIANNTAALAWMVGLNSPYTIRFATVTFPSSSTPSYLPSMPLSPSILDTIIILAISYLSFLLSPRLPRKFEVESGILFNKLAKCVTFLHLQLN